MTVAAVLHSDAAGARTLRRKDNAPVTAEEESFTAARHHAIRSMASSQVTTPHRQQPRPCHPRRQQNTRR